MAVPIDAYGLLVVDGPWPGEEGRDLDGFRDAAETVVAIARRAEHSGVSREDLVAYQAACSAVERLARSRTAPSLQIDAAGLDRLARRMESGVDGVLSTVHPPGDAGDWCRALAETAEAANPQLGQQLRKLAKQLAGRRGLVLSLAPADRQSTTVVAMDDHRDSSGSWARPAGIDVAALRACEPTWAAFEGDERRHRATRSLWQETLTRLAEGEPVAVGAGAPHDVIAEVLNALQRSPTPPEQLRVLYADGSEATPFPLGPLSGGEVADRRVRVGLMSTRHPELDRDVDGYWFRNRLVSVSRTLAETDAYCEQATIQQLGELTGAGIGMIELVHTGFEPAAVGFYRAIRRWTAEQLGPPVRVHPEYLIRGRRQPGSRWPSTEGSL